MKIIKVLRYITEKIRKNCGLCPVKLFYTIELSKSNPTGSKYEYDVWVWSFFQIQFQGFQKILKIKQLTKKKKSKNTGLRYFKRV